MKFSLYDDFRHPDNIYKYRIAVEYIENAHGEIQPDLFIEVLKPQESGWIKIEDEKTKLELYELLIFQIAIMHNPNLPEEMQRHKAYFDKVKSGYAINEL